MYTGMPGVGIGKQKQDNCTQVFTDDYAGTFVLEKKHA